jgi:ABC-type transport system substrate-binding protein
MKTLAASAAVIGLLLFSSFAIVPLSRTAADTATSATTSCSANNVIKIIIPNGTPRALASKINSGLAGNIIQEIQYYGAYPTIAPAGALYWNQSLVDWINHNANYTQWTINIIPGLKWSNGQNVTSQDILSTYSSGFFFNNQYDVTGAHNEVTSIVKLNSSAVQFNLNTTDAQFVVKIGPAVLDHVFPSAQDNLNYTGFGITTVDVGPYYVDNYQPGQTQMLMLRNPYFYTTGLPEPAACGLEIFFVESTSVVSTDMASGTADLGFSLDPNTVSSVTQNSNNHILSEQDAQIQQMRMNETTYPLNMTAFRQALVYAVNESQIVQQAWGGYAAAAYSSEGTIPPTVTSLYNSNQMNYSYNPNTAIQLLHSIGFTGGTNGAPLDYANGTEVTLTLWSDNTHSGDVTAAGIVKTGLAEIGITLTVNFQKSVNTFTSVKPATLYLSDGSNAIFASAYSDSLPGYDVYAEPTGVAQADWLAPASANSQYLGNLSIIQNSADQATDQKALNNIQALQAQYLPVITLSYPDLLFAYSTKNWVGWEAAQGWIFQNSAVNNQLLAELKPAGSSPTTTGPTTSSQSTTGVPPTTTNSLATSTTATTTSSSTPGSTSSSTLLIIAAIVIVVIVVGAVAFMMMRRKGPG